MDLSGIEAKYMNFSKSKRPSYTNYLQRSKKSFIGYDPERAASRQASKVWTQWYEGDNYKPRTSSLSNNKRVSLDHSSHVNK